MSLANIAKILKHIEAEDKDALQGIHDRATMIMTNVAIQRGFKRGVDSILKGTFWKAAFDYLTAANPNREQARKQFHADIGLKGLSFEDQHEYYRVALLEYFGRQDTVNIADLPEDLRDYLTDSAPEHHPDPSTP